MAEAPSWHLPEPDPETAPYWEAARDGRLTYKECRSCRQAFFYPRARCPRCWSADTVWRDASGDGTVHTFTVVHQNDLPPFKDRVPYVVALIDLEAGVRMTSNVEGCPPEDVECGMPVRVAFRQEAAGSETFSIPVFHPR